MIFVAIIIIFLLFCSCNIINLSNWQIFKFVQFNCHKLKIGRQRNFVKWLDLKCTRSGKKFREEAWGCGTLCPLTIYATVHQDVCLFITVMVVFDVEQKINFAIYSWKQTVERYKMSPDITGKVTFDFHGRHRWFRLRFDISQRVQYV